MLALRDEVIDALVKTETRGSDNLHYIREKNSELNSLSENELVERMR